MSLLVTGSIAIDSVQTPFGKSDGLLGGSASYFSYAASFFGPVRLVGAVGPDFPEEFIEHGTQDILRAKYGLDARGIVQQVLTLFPSLNASPLLIGKED